MKHLFRFFRGFVFFNLVFFYSFFSNSNFYEENIFDQQIDKSHWKYVDFDSSMGKGGRYYRRCLENEKGFDLCSEPRTPTELLNFFRDLYNKNNLSVKRSKGNKKIPKIIHQIWVGSEFPDKYKKWAESWKKIHPDWEYRLWTEKEIEEFGLVNKKLYDRTPNYGAKANIARYEILYRIGGLYIDTDFECLKSFDVLHENYEFFSGISCLDGKVLYLANGLIGSIPGHPILKFCVEKLGKNFFDIKYISKFGPVYFTKVFWHVVSQMEKSSAYDHIIALPATYFYPAGVRRKKLRGQELLDYLKYFSEAYATHYWEGSWLKQYANREVEDFQIGPNGKYMASWISDSSFQLYDLINSNKGVFDTFLSNVNLWKVSSDGKYIVIQFEDGSLQLFQLVDGFPKELFDQELVGVSKFEFSSDARCLSTWYTNGLFELYQLGNGIRKIFSLDNVEKLEIDKNFKIMVALINKEKKELRIFKIPSAVA